MKKHQAIYFTFGLLAGFITVEAQEKPVLAKQLVTYSTKQSKRHLAQIAIKASSAGDSLYIYCDPQSHKNPCAVAYSTIPPGIPKCNPAICHSQLFFIREMDGRYQAKLTVDNKVSTLAVKTNGPEFNRKMSSMTKIAFVETRGR